MKKTKILYIWGYGDSPDSENINKLRKKLDSKNFTVISDYYAQYSPKEAIYDLENLIKENKIDLIIGENLGGYLVTLLNNDLQKIIINPIFDPVLELKEYSFLVKDDKNNIIEKPLVPEHIINFYEKNKDLEKYYNDVYGIFSLEDNFDEYSKLCKCIKCDDPIQKIIETIKDIKYSN